MNKILVFFLSLVALCSAPFAVADQSKVDFTFAYDVKEGFPSFMGDGTETPAEYPGTYIEIMRLVAERLPINLKLERYPWGRCKSLIKSNEVDAINSSYKLSRAEIGEFPLLSNGEVDVSRRITSDTYRLYALNSSSIGFDPDRKTITNLERDIFAPIGYSIVGDMREWGIPVKEHPVGIHEMLQMLLLKRASAVVAHENQARYTLTQDPDFQQIKAIQPPVSEKPYYILISKKFYREHPELSERIWDEIANLRRTHLPNMLARYNALFEN